VLLGGDHASADAGSSGASGSGFALMIGGGVDVKVRRHWAIRAIQADWFLVHGSGGTSNENIRISIGAVYRF
jgi:hypothetical protein